MYSVDTGNVEQVLDPPNGKFTPRIAYASKEVQIVKRDTNFNLNPDGKHIASGAIDGIITIFYVAASSSNLGRASNAGSTHSDMAGTLSDHPGFYACHFLKTVSVSLLRLLAMRPRNLNRRKKYRWEFFVFSKAIMDTLLNMHNDGILVLPYEMLIKIFGYLSHGDLQQVKLVCKEWCQLVRVPELKRKSKLLITEWNEDDLYYDYLEHHKEILIHKSVEVRDYRSWKRDYGESERCLFEILRKLGEHIFKLKISRKPNLVLINEYLPQLKELDLRSIREIFPIEVVDATKFPHVESLLMPNEPQYNFLRFSKNSFQCLKKLSVKLRFEDLEIYLPFLEDRAPSLRWLEVDTLDIEDSKSYEVKFEKIFKKCVQLEVLIIKAEAIYSRNEISKAIVVGLPQENCLKTIDLHYTDYTDMDLWEFILQKWSKSLECVRWLGYGRKFKKQLSPFNGKLRHLELHWFDPCENFLNVIAPKENTMLTGLKLEGYIYSFSSVTLRALFQNLPNLIALNLIGFAGLDNETLVYIFDHLVHLRHLCLERCNSCEGAGFLCAQPKTTNLQSLQTLVSCYCPIAALSNSSVKFQFKELTKLGLLCCQMEKEPLLPKIRQSAEYFPVLETLFLEDDEDLCFFPDGQMQKHCPRLRASSSEYDCDFLDTMQKIWASFLPWMNKRDYEANGI
uniref:F-box domain-containing protein n=1 Tax=Glossina pallidipes TaxID=7398 RepID=A0A1B0AAP9_GLOPL